MRSTHDDLSAFEQVKVKGVRRMANLPQRVVRGVGCIVDGALIDQCKSAGDFVGRRLDRYSANNLCGVPRTAFAVVDLNLERMDCGRLRCAALRSTAVRSCRRW